jgi:hypothetical protein
MRFINQVRGEWGDTCIGFAAGGIWGDTGLNGSDFIVNTIIENLLP